MVNKNWVSLSVCEWYLEREVTRGNVNSRGECIHWHREGMSESCISEYSWSR